MQFDETYRHDALVVTIKDTRIDAAVALDFKDAMRDLATKAPNRIILDLGHVEFIDSSGLGALIGTMKQLQPERRFEIARPQPAVDRVFKLTRLHSVLTIHDTLPSDDNSGETRVAHAQ